jgi:DNA-binding NtrC family response regulator
LQNLVERLAVLKGSGEIAIADLPAPIRSAAAMAPAPSAHAPDASLPAEGIDLYAALAELEDRLINEALERSGGNKNQAAKILKLNRTTLVEKLKKRAKADTES